MRINAHGHFIKIPLLKRFWEKVNKNGPVHPTDKKLGRCWVWTGARLKRKYPYGLIWNDTHTKRLRAHRVAWKFKYGRIPKGKDILHSCDNPPCVNWDHLRPGTCADNHKDMISHGHSLFGERNPNVRLTAKQIKHILFVYPKATRTGPRSIREKQIILKLCKKYSITFNFASRIARRQRWKHLNYFPRAKEPTHPPSSS